MSRPSLFGTVARGFIVSGPSPTLPKASLRPLWPTLLLPPLARPAHRLLRPLEMTKGPAPATVLFSGLFSTAAR